MTTKNQDTLEGYESSLYGKELFLAEAKVGKTITLLGGLLGVMPWQEFGGVVDKPEHLHIITFDAAALGGAQKFLVDKCGASKEIGKVHVINLQKDAAKAFASGSPYDGTFPATVYEAVDRVQQLATKGGVHALMISSLTMMAKAWLRSISGPAFTGSSMKASAMDQNKWGLFKQQLTEFQFHVQVDTYHTIWEAHLGEKTSKEKDGAGMAQVLDTIQVDGSTAQTFPAQVERLYIMARTKGGWKPKSAVDMVQFDTQPNLNFGSGIMSGRKVTGTLEPKENDLTLMFDKLGLKVGGWGA